MHTTMNAVAEFFNTKAAKWDEHNTLSTPEKIDYILKAAGVRNADSVLDIGTGTGVLLPHIAHRTGVFGSINAVDISAGMLALAHDKYAGLNCPTQFTLADVERDSLYGYYDRIIIYCVYPHLRHPMATLHRLADQNLAAHGTITIAHPIGREFINAVHSHTEVFSNGLPPATELAATLAEQGFLPDYIEESSQIYIVRFRQA